MPTLSDSGSRLIPTDEYNAILLAKAGSSLQDTTNLPVLRSNPISPLPLTGPVWQRAPRQHLRYEHSDRAFFGIPEHYGRLMDFSLRSWLLFLEYAGVAIGGYGEQGIARRAVIIYRLHVANDLLQREKLQLLTDGSRYLIAPLPAYIPTCRDLANAGRWSQQLCCTQCHAEGNVFEEVFEFIDDPLDGRRTQRRVMICCAVHRFIHDWHPYLQLLPEKQMCVFDELEAMEND